LLVLELGLRLRIAGAPDGVKQPAFEAALTVSHIAALRRLLQQRDPLPDLQQLPALKSGGHLVDVANREALYQAMEE